MADSAIETPVTVAAGVREGAEKDETVLQLAKPPTPQIEEPPVAEHTLKPPLLKVAMCF
ncbi:MAG: hypothetical protein JF606_23835 [Burkholderiales bacterium]|nr:hypothetical protein [Burkholderiales bacterium]